VGDAEHTEDVSLRWWSRWPALATIVAEQADGVTIDPATRRWLAAIPERLRVR
jgi:hypothetical protein